MVRLRDLDCQNRAVDADEILRRLDDHLAVANEHMARANEHMARGNELWAENRRELREMSARLDRVTQAFLDELREQRTAFREEMQAQREVLRDLVAESRAQRRGLRAVLVRLGGGSPAAAGA